MDVSELQRETEHYWDESPKWELSRRISWYTENLLPFELQCARQKRRITKVSCDMLVLLVGYSWEPLLQTVCVYKPKAIYPVVNKTYNDIDGSQKFTELRKAVQEMQNVELLKREWLSGDSPPSFPALNNVSEWMADSPEEVFKALRKGIIPLLNGEPRPNVVIDITGAKKSMVAGAYLFAAYADVDVSYVDFDHYSEIEGKPYGYSCKIGSLKNPYQAFLIAEWQRVMELYAQYAFRSARDTLRTIQHAIKAENYFEDGEKAAVSRLGTILEILDLWESGDLNGAFKAREGIPPQDTPGGSIPWPDVLDRLGAKWPDYQQSRSGRDLENAIALLEAGANSLYESPEDLCAYADDELAKIGRLISLRSDYRSAFLRAASLTETLLRARIMMLWLGDQLFYITDQGTASKRSETTGRNTIERLAELSSFDIMIPFLESSWRAFFVAGSAKLVWARDQQRLKKEIEKRARNIVDPDGKTSEEQRDRAIAKLKQNLQNESFTESEDRLLLNDQAVLFSGFQRLRNKAIHFCLPVPESVAAHALQLTEDNLGEYKERWANVKQTIPTVAPGWQDLLDRTGIKFIPPPPRDSDHSPQTQ